MKKIIYLIMSLLIIGIVSAQPNPLDSGVLLSSMEQPLPPSGTGTVGECTPPETKDYTCKGDISSYMQCVETTTQGGVWQLQQINCKDYGQEVDCVNGKCVRQGVGLPIEPQYQTWIIIGLIILIFLLWKRRSK